MKTKVKMRTAQDRSPVLIQRKVFDADEKGGGNPINQLTGLRQLKCKYFRSFIYNNKYIVRSPVVYYMSTYVCMSSVVYYMSTYVCMSPVVYYISTYVCLHILVYVVISSVIATITHT